MSTWNMNSWFQQVKQPYRYFPQSYHQYFTDFHKIGILMFQVDCHKEKKLIKTGEKYQEVSLEQCRYKVQNAKQQTSHHQMMTQSQKKKNTFNIKIMSLLSSKSFAKKRCGKKCDPTGVSIFQKRGVWGVFILSQNLYLPCFITESKGKDLFFCFLNLEPFSLY